MAPPSSRNKALRLALVDYLQTQMAIVDPTLAGNPAFNWEHYANEHAATDPPKGALWFIGYTADEQQIINRQSLIRRVLLRLFVSDSNVSNAIALADDWVEALFTGDVAIMRGLFVNGHSGTYAGITFDRVFKGIMLTNDVTGSSQDGAIAVRLSENQAGGATATITAEYSFTDRTSTPWVNWSL